MTKKSKNTPATTFVVPPKPDRPDGRKPPAIFVQKQEPVAPAQAKRNIEGRKLPGNIVRVPSRRRNPKGAVGKELNDKIKAMAPGFASNTVAGAADIVELARALKSDVDLIWQFVHDNIEFLPTMGSQKGAWGCLIDGMGNSFDQSDLMIQLLTEAGYSASYMYGELRLTEAEAADWLGTDVSDIYAASNLLAEGGIPNAVVWTGSAYVLDLNHCWVRCTIGMTNYYFDPALKEYEVVSGIDLATAMDYDRTDFMNNATSGATITSDYVQDMNRSNVRSDLNTFASNLVDYIRTNNHAATMDDIVGGRKIVPTSDTPLRQTSHPKLKPMTSPTVWSSIPNGYKAILGVDYDTISVSFYSADIHGKRLTIWFNGSNEAELRLDGSLVATSSAQTPNSWNSVLLTATHPYPTSFADSAVWNTVWEGKYHLLAQAWGNAGKKMTEFHNDLMQENVFNGGSASDEDVLGESLNVIFHTWNSQKSWVADILNRMTNCTTVLHHQTGLVGYYDTPYADLGGVVWASSALDNDWSNVDTNDTGLAMHGIALEGSVLKDTCNISGVSTTPVIDIAVQNGLKIYDAGTGNWSSTVRPGVSNYTTPQLDDIENWWVNFGWRVVLPEDGQITKNSWTGLGYYAISPWYGAVGIITGALKGLTGSETASVTEIIDERLKGHVDNDPEDDGPEFIPQEPQLDPRGGPGGGGGGGQGPGGGGQPTGGDPVNFVDGSFAYRNLDLSLGSQSYPYRLSLIRSYSSRNRLRDSSLGLGWTHNHHINFKIKSDCCTGIGMNSLLSGIPGLVDLFVSTDLYRDLAKPLDKWVTVALTNQWLVDNVADNIVTITSGSSGRNYTRLPDGSFVAPSGCSSTLIDNLDGTFTLTSKQQEVFDFNSNGTINNISYPFGVTVSYSYSTGLISSVTNNLGRTLTFTHSTGKLTSVSDGTGRSVSYTRDVDGNLIEFSNADNKDTTYSYISPGLIESIFYPENPLDPVVTNTYDSLNRVMEQTDAYSNLSKYYLGGSRSEFENAENNSRIFYLNRDGFTVRYINEVGDTWLNTYDGLNRLVRNELPEGNAQEYEYDIFSNVLSFIYKAKPGSMLSDIVSAFTYDSTWNKIETQTDNVNRTTTFTYDVLTGQVLTIEQPVVNSLTPTTTFTYNNRGQVETIEDPTGVVTEFTYDSVTEKLEQVVVDVNGLALTTIYDHNSRGDVESVTDPNGNETLITHNDLRKVVQVEAPSPFGYITNYSYDDNANLISIERETGDVLNPWQTTSATYFIDNLLESVTDSSSQTTSFEYTVLRKPWKTTNPESLVLERMYDATGRLEQVIDQANNTCSIRAYTVNGLIESAKDANLNETVFEYDGFDRSKKTIYPNSTFEEFFYNSASLIDKITTRNGDDITFTYDDLNRLETKSPDAMAVETYVYDLAGRLQTISTPVIANHPESGTFTYGYDTAGRKTSEQYPDGKTISLTLDDCGNTVRVDYPGSYYIEQVFDEIHRLTDIKLNGSGSAALHFDYDPLSRRTALTYENGTSVSYSHEMDDDLEQLIHTFTGSSVTFDYDFNTIHQLIGQSVSDDQFLWHPSSGGTVSYGTADALNHYPTVGGLSQAYNNNGCLTDNGVWDFGFDTVDQLISATDGITSVSYLYDPAGRQLQKNVGGTKTNYLYDGNQRVADYDGTGTLLQRYIYGIGIDEPLIKITAGGTKTYMHLDRIGNVVAISNSSGVVTNRYKYSPWGESPSMSGSTFGFQGQRFDADTGLYYMKARYYDPKIGRFLQPDPAGYYAGLNLYTFASNTPLVLSDPLGTVPTQSGHVQAVGGEGWDFMKAKGMLEDLFRPGLKNFEDPWFDLTLAVALMARFPQLAAAAASGGGVTVLETTVVAEATQVTPVILQASARGRGYQAFFHQLTETLENTGIRLPAMGGGKNAIPDLIMQDIILEIKDVARLSYSPQLKTLVNTALAQGKKVDLIVSETNKYISGPLEAAIRSTGGWIIRVNSKTGGAKIL